MPDPNVERLKKLCASLPGSVEEFPWDHSVFKVAGKMFVIFGDASPSITVKTTFEKKPLLEQDPAVEHAPYLGNKGWVTVTFTDENTTDFAQALLEESYQLVIAKLPKKKQAELAGEAS